MVQTNYAAGTDLPANQLNTDFSKCVSLAGDTMYGLLTLSGDPLNPLHAATKEYVDQSIVGGPSGGVFVQKSGDTMSGLLTLNAGIAMGGATATGFGSNIGQLLGPLENFNSTGLPGLHTASRLIFQRQTITGSDSSDFQFQRIASYTGSSSGVNKVMLITTTIGANVQAIESGLLIQSTSNGVSGGRMIPLWVQGIRNAGSTDLVRANIFSATDLNNLSSQAVGAQQLVTEYDLFGVLADDYTNPAKFGGKGGRHFIHFATNQQSASGTPYEVTTGLWFDTGGNGDPTTSTIDQVIGFAVGTQIRAALDTRGAVIQSGSTDPVAAVVMAAGHTIEFNGSNSLTSNPGRNYFAYDSVNSKLKYYVNGVAKWSIDASGNVRAAGTITPSVTP